MNNIDKVLNAKINEKIILNNCSVIEIRFESWINSTDEWIKKHPYTWVGYLVSNRWETIFPMRNTNYVAFFKTLAGAKRNFIRQYL